MTPDPNNPTVIADNLSHSEAESLVAYLQDRGFDATVWGANVAALEAVFAGSLSAQVVVRQSEAERAREAVNEFQRK